MAELKVDEIETISTNQDIKVVTKSPDGALEIKGNGGNDGTLQLNCSAQSHGVKLKSPPNSVGQNYTMVLPDNQIAASKILKVKSVTGSGSNAVGQLEYTDIPSTDLTNLDATNLTSGTIPAARFPTGGVPATSGAGLQLISKTTFANSDIRSVDITGLEADSMYRLVGKYVDFTDTSYYDVEGSHLRMKWLDSTGSPYTNGIYINYWRYGYDSHNSAGNAGELELHCGSNEMGYAFIAEFCTGSGSGHATGSIAWMMFDAFHPGWNNSKNETYASFNSTYASRQIHGLRLFPYDQWYPFVSFQGGDELLLYKYNES